ncbi:MAG: MFS transporter, partial [Microcoleus sp. SIO2G3]|nr:MFS transporter [Microcoleus sp. SIO2G3]
LAMRLRSRPVLKADDATPLQRIREGFVYAFGFAPIRDVLLLLATFSLFAMSYTTLVPIYATQILHGDAHTLGWLMAASGVGALMGGLYLSSRKTVVGLGKVIAIAPALSGAGLIAFSQSRSLWLSLLVALFIGLGSILLIASSNTVLQAIVDEDKRGRVLSLFTMAFLGMTPFGNLLSGSLASQIGVPKTMLIGGTVCLFASIAFARHLPALRRLVRPIYERAGILPPANHHTAIEH